MFFSIQMLIPTLSEGIRELLRKCKLRKITKIVINPQAPVAQKITDEVVFRHFQGEGVEFFKIGPH